MPKKILGIAIAAAAVLILTPLRNGRQMRLRQLRQAFIDQRADDCVMTLDDILKHDRKNIHTPPVLKGILAEAVFNNRLAEFVGILTGPSARALDRMLNPSLIKTAVEKLIKDYSGERRRRLMKGIESFVDGSPNPEFHAAYFEAYSGWRAERASDRWWETKPNTQSRVNPRPSP